MPYMVTFTINIHQMLAHIPYMDPMGYDRYSQMCSFLHVSWMGHHVTPHASMASPGGCKLPQVKEALELCESLGSPGGVMAAMAMTNTVGTKTWIAWDSNVGNHGKIII